MRRFFPFLAVIMMALFASVAAPRAAATDEAERLYQSYGDAVYQVQVVDLASGKKTGIGSGFQFTADGLIATNYHVVAEAIQNPGNNRVEFLQEKGGKGQLKVLAADVVHDLAIVRMDRPGKTFLGLGASGLKNGTKLFALGNPHDIGLTIIEGAYNGLSRESFIDKIHFSGALNPGMSGGPVLGHDGKVVGVNVATAGNEISFLVPVEPLRSLLDNWLHRPAGYDFVGHADAYIQEQLLQNQKNNVKVLLKKKWESLPFGPVMVPGRIHDVLRCWGGINHKEKDPYQYYLSVCSTQDRLFLNEDFSTGLVFYRYNYITGKDNLNLTRFYTLYEQQYAPTDEDYDYNNAKEDDVTNFECNNSFVNLAGFRWKSSFCTRQYKKYPALFDMHLYMAMVGEGKKGFTVTWLAEGVSKESALALAKKFMGEIKPLPAKPIDRKGGRHEARP